MTQSQSYDSNPGVMQKLEEIEKKAEMTLV